MAISPHLLTTEVTTELLQVTTKLLHADSVFSRSKSLPALPDLQLLATNLQENLKSCPLFRPLVLWLQRDVAREHGQPHFTKPASRVENSRGAAETRRVQGRLNKKISAPPPLRVRLFFPAIPPRPPDVPAPAVTVPPPAVTVPPPQITGPAPQITGRPSQITPPVL